jgi:hypothetical protein
MTTEYELAVKDLKKIPLKRLKEFMKKINAYQATMKKKDIIHIIATLHHHSISGSGILDFGLKILKKAGEGVVKEVKKNVINGVKGLESTTGNILLQNVDKQHQQHQQIEQQQRLLQQAEAEKRHIDFLKTMNP